MIQGSIQQPKSLKLTTTSVTDILTLAAGRSDIVTVVGALIVNQDSAARKVTLFWTENVTDYAFFEHTVGANESVSFMLDAPLQLYAKQTARKIRAQAAAANVVTVTIISTSSPQQAPNAG